MSRSVKILSGLSITIIIIIIIIIIMLWHACHVMSLTFM